MLAAFVGKGRRAEGSPTPSSRPRSPLSGLRLSPDPPEESETGRLWMELGNQRGGRDRGRGEEMHFRDRRPGEVSETKPVSAGCEAPGRAEETPRFLHPLTAGQVSMGVQCEGHRALWTVSAHKGDASFLQTKPRDEQHRRGP